MRDFMKFVHIADVHLDVPFTVLEGRKLADKSFLYDLVREAV